MPTYEFSCPQGHDFEKFYRSMAGAPTEVGCPVCGRPATRRVSGGAGLLFKGSGFYITDYGKDGKKDLKNPAPKPDTAKSDASAKSGSSSPATSAPPAKSGE